MAEKFNYRSRTTKTGIAAAIVLVLIFLAQCVSAAKRDSVSWDESQHLYSGWLSWKHADFGFNPEVPPLVKMWCAIPLLHRDIAQPAYIGGSFKKEGFVLGQRFLAANGIDRTLIPARLMAVLLSALLAITVFLAALERFGSNPNVSGLILVSDGVVAGADIPGQTNPYAHFQALRPDAVIDCAVYVYKGQFNLGPAAALEHVEASETLLLQGRAQEALAEAELGKRLDPGSATAWEAEGDALQALGRPAEAQLAYRNALQASELDPVFQKELVMALRTKSGQ